jgi:hypothetical protein
VAEENAEIASRWIVDKDLIECRTKKSGPFDYTSLYPLGSNPITIVNSYFESMMPNRSVEGNLDWDVVDRIEENLVRLANSVAVGIIGSASL